MFNIIQQWKNTMKGYLSTRKKELKREATQFRTIDEAYRAGFLKGFWEGAGESLHHSLDKV